MNSVTKFKTAGLVRLGSSLVAIACAAGLALPTASYAQTSDGSLRGSAPAGAEITVKSVDTGAVRKSVAGADGNYVVVGLPAGSYHVTAGDKAEGDVVVSVASVSVLNLAPAGNEKAAIVVSGKRLTSEIHTSQANEILSLHDIAALPQVTRNFLEFADTVPGMTFTLDQGHKTSIRGGAQLDSAVNVYIDGVSQKDYVGSGGGTGGSGSGFPAAAVRTAAATRATRSHSSRSANTRL